jgi:DNA-binding CsgD family transcriptional regulator
MLMLLGTPRILAPSDQWLLFVWTQQLSLVFFLILCSFIFRKLEKNIPSGSSFFAGFLLSTASLLYLLAFSFGYNSLLMSILTGGVLGLACAVSFLLWQTVYANEGQNRSAIYLPVSSIIVVAVCLILKMADVVVVAFSMVALIPFLASYMLYQSLKVAEPFNIRPTKQFAPSIIRDLWKPILCAVVVCFAWGLAKHMPSLFDATLLTAILIGVAAASLIIVLTELFTAKGVEILNVYQAIFPFLGIVLFIPGLFGNQWMQLLIGSLSFGSQTLMLLMFLISAAYASRMQLSPVLIYSVCIIPLQIALFFGDSLGYIVVASSLAEGYGMHIAIICLVVLFCGLVIVSFSGKQQKIIGPADDTLMINLESMTTEAVIGDDAFNKGQTKEESRIDSVVINEALWQELSSREVEVTNLLLKGNSIAAIAKKLFISENTARGHTKRIYRKLEIHSRQELIDLFEQDQSGV